MLMKNETFWKISTTQKKTEKGKQIKRIPRDLEKH